MLMNYKMNKTKDLRLVMTRHASTLTLKAIRAAKIDRNMFLIKAKPNFLEKLLIRNLIVSGCKKLQSRKNVHLLEA